MLELQPVVDELLQGVVAELLGHGLPGGWVVHGVLVALHGFVGRQRALLDQAAPLKVQHVLVLRLKVALHLDQLHLVVTQSLSLLTLSSSSSSLQFGVIDRGYIKLYFFSSKKERKKKVLIIVFCEIHDYGHRRRR